jgi:hypothetical protein
MNNDNNNNNDKSDKEEVKVPETKKIRKRGTYKKKAELSSTGDNSTPKLDNDATLAKPKRISKKNKEIDVIEPAPK